MRRDDIDESMVLKQQIAQERACVVEILCDIDRIRQGQGKERRQGHWQSQGQEQGQGKRQGLEQVETNALDAKEHRELSALHRCLVERLHPFTNPDASDACREKLNLVRLALRRGDVPMMRSLERITRNERGSVRAIERLQSADECRAELALANAQVNVLHEQRELLRGHA